MAKYKVLISTLGRSHFVIAAEWLVKRGVNATLLQGWIPKSVDSFAVRLATKFIRRKSFVAGLQKRNPPGLREHTISAPLGEIVQTVWMLTIGRLSHQLHSFGFSVAFGVHGLCTRKYLRGYDIYHVKSGLGRGGAIRVAKKLGMKVLVDHCVPHQLSMKKTTGEKGYDEWWSYWNVVMKDCADADLIMVGSEYVKETFVEFGYKPEMIRVVPLGVLPMFSHLKKSYLKSGCLELVYTGNFGHWKGIDDLVDSIAVLTKRGIDVHLTAVGSHSETAGYYQKAKSLNLPITFAGHVPQQDLRGFLERAEVYVFPSLRDGFAVSAFEGLAAGLCLVTTTESSIPIRDGVTGFRIPSHNPEAIADRIEYLNRNRDVIERVGRAGADDVEKNFTWEKYAENVERVYEELMIM